ncbi:hypothetical protein [Rhizobium sp. 42MFCr.1]|uniref:hypothetical protein n=1 Tax=Rhizobium sp. 42MFCr.1 TaxID=1048680 RepID=UPI000366DA36|nr:hypothetical protein [Rhizobium sp. 42MFCr.1]
MTKLITEIKLAQFELPYLDRVDRRNLVGRIVDELRTYRSRKLGELALDRYLHLDALIKCVSVMIADIAELDDAEFQRVLNEFAKLVAVLENLASGGKDAATLH